MREESASSTGEEAGHADADADAVQAEEGGIVVLFGNEDSQLGCAMWDSQPTLLLARPEIHNDNIWHSPRLLLEACS